MSDTIADQAIRATPLRVPAMVIGLVMASAPGAAEPVHPLDTLDVVVSEAFADCVRTGSSRSENCVDTAIDVCFDHTAGYIHNDLPCVNGARFAVERWIEETVSADARVVTLASLRNAYVACHERAWPVGERKDHCLLSAARTAFENLSMERP